MPKKRALDSSTHAAPAKRRITSNHSDGSVIATPLPLNPWWAITPWWITCTTHWWWDRGDEQKKKKVAEDFVKSIMGAYEEISMSKAIPKVMDIPTSKKIAMNKRVQNGEQFPKSNKIPESSGMFVLRNVVQLEDAMTSNIVIRDITEPFWQACIDTINTPNVRYRVCAVGTPGIGKTTSTPILIRMLLAAKHTVVYRIRTVEKYGWYYEFTPDKTSKMIVTKVYRERYGYEGIASLSDSSTYYVVDPGETDNNSSPPRNFAAKFILVSSPDECYWGEPQFTKQRGKRKGFSSTYPCGPSMNCLMRAPSLALHSRMQGSFNDISKLEAFLGISLPMITLLRRLWRCRTQR